MYLDEEAVRAAWSRGEIEICIQTFHATDQQTADTFNGVKMP